MKLSGVMRKLKDKVKQLTFEVLKENLSTCTF